MNWLYVGESGEVVDVNLEDRNNFPSKQIGYKS